MLKNKEYLFVDFSEFHKITQEDRELNRKRIFTGGVRINNGMYRTAKEDEEYRSKSLKRKLP